MDLRQEVHEALPQLQLAGRWGYHGLPRRVWHQQQNPDSMEQSQWRVPPWLQLTSSGGGVPGQITL